MKHRIQLTVVVYVFKSEADIQRACFGKFNGASIDCGNIECG